MYGADPRLFAARHEDRLPPAVRRGRASATRWASRTCTTSTTSSTRCAELRAHAADDDPRRIVKLNEGVSGAGNALVDLPDLPAPGRRTSGTRSAPARARAWRFEHPDVPFDAYLGEARGATAASSRSGSPGVELRSPSVQLRVTPLGEVELLSTHDQLLGGPSGQSYLGCRFPADFAYARAITARGRRDRRAARPGGRARPVRRRLRRGPGRERRLDAVRDRAQPAQGRHDAPVPDAAVPHRRPLRPATALFPTPSGREKHLVATDHLESDALRGPQRRRPLRHRRAPRPALRPGPADRRRLPHDQLPHRARPGRADGRRRHPGSRPTPSTAGPSGSCSRRPGSRSTSPRSRRSDAGQSSWRRATGPATTLARWWRRSRPASVTPASAPVSTR